MRKLHFATCEREPENPRIEFFHAKKMFVSLCFFGGQTRWIRIEKMSSLEQKQIRQSDTVMSIHI
jgi:hypothetical protein